MIQMYLFIISKILKYSIIHNRRGLKAKRLDFNAFEPFPSKVGKEERCSKGKRVLKHQIEMIFCDFELLSVECRAGLRLKLGS